jgi:uncharacterized protein YjbI with pentapeptide repeats
MAYMDFSELQLKEVIFTDSILQGVKMLNSKCTSCLFKNVDFSKADLFKTDLSGSEITDTDLKNTTLNETDLSSTKLNNLDFKRSFINNIKTKNAVLFSVTGIDN